MMSDMDMKKKSKLSKLSMPKKKSDEDMASDYGLEMEAEPGEEAMAGEEEMDMGMDGEEMPPVEDAQESMLTDVPDEELLAEMKKRGLSAQLEESSEEEFPA